MINSFLDIFFRQIFPYSSYTHTHIYSELEPNCKSHYTKVWLIADLTAKYFFVTVVPRGFAQGTKTAVAMERVIHNVLFIHTYVNVLI